MEKPEVLDHWYAPVFGFNASTQEFYRAIEAELKSRQVPGLEISRVEYSEGGLLSQKREYLRLYRERLVKKITVGKDEIDISFCYLPSFKELAVEQRTLKCAW